MPSFGMNSLTPPTDPKEYEKIIRDYCEYQFGGNVFLFGRNGQRQNGVDVISKDLSNIIGVQCKDYSGTVVKESDIDDMIKLAETFVPPLCMFVIAIAQKTDANIQRYVMLKSKERLKHGKFSIEIVYWDEIENFIKNNAMIYNKYYGFAFGNPFNEQQVQVLITDTYSLRMRFLDMYCRWGIRDVILMDMFTGIFYMLISNYDCFYTEINELMRNSCILQETETYQRIKSFIKKLDEYMDYIGRLVELNSNYMYVVVNPEVIENAEDYKTNIDRLRTVIVEKFLSATELKEF